MALKQKNNLTSFGSLFEELRKNAGYSIEKLSEETKIPKRHIEALEFEKFESLPPDVYVRGFISKCCDSLGANEEKERLFRLYYQQGRFRVIGQHSHRESAKRPIAIRPRQMWILTAGIFILSIFIYFLANFIPYVFSPEITLANPSEENFVVNFSDFIIEGQAKNTAQLTLNGKEMYIGKNGVFDDVIELREGVNILKFEARNILGRTTEVVSRVVYIADN